MAAEKVEFYRNCVKWLVQNETPSFFEPEAHSSLGTKEVVFFKYQGRSKKQPANNYRLGVANLNDFLGVGQFGAVYGIGAFAINYKFNDLTYKKEKVVKFFYTVDEEEKERILREYKMGKKTPHLGMCEPVFEGTSCYLVMNRLEGRNLFDLFADEKNIFNPSLSWILEFSYQLAVAYKTQVNKCDLVHRDLKPENILVEESPIRVNIVDFGFAKEKDTIDGKSLGSPAYVAPDMLYENYEPQSPCDIFSIARVLALFFLNADEIKAFYNIIPGSYYDKLDQFKNRLFSLVEEEECDECSAEMILLLLDMLDMTPGQRPDIDEVIERVKSIRDRYQSQEASSSATPVLPAGNKLLPAAPSCPIRFLKSPSKRNIYSNVIDRRQTYQPLLFAPAVDNEEDDLWQLDCQIL